MQNLRAFSSRDEPKIAWRVMVWKKFGPYD
jgi:hypothetical protein